MLDASGGGQGVGFLVYRWVRGRSAGERGVRSGGERGRLQGGTFSRVRWGWGWWWGWRGERSRRWGGGGVSRATRFGGGVRAAGGGRARQADGLPGGKGGKRDGGGELQGIGERARGGRALVYRRGMREEWRAQQGCRGGTFSRGRWGVLPRYWWCGKVAYPGVREEKGGGTFGRVRSTGGVRGRGRSGGRVGRLAAIRGGALFSPARPCWWCVPTCQLFDLSGSWRVGGARVVREG